jgi:hypothetical protein
MCCTRHRQQYVIETEIFGLPQEFLINAKNTASEIDRAVLIRFLGISLFMPALNPLETIERPAA